MAQILIAEDDHALGDIWTRAFQKYNYTVILVKDGKQAIEYLRNNPLPALLVLDHDMPFFNGFQVHEVLRELDPNHTVPTVMVTANPNAQFGADARDIEMFLIKPVSFSEMKLLIERLLKPYSAAG